MLEKLNDSDLVEAYKKAIKNNLPEDFIKILEVELKSRKLESVIYS